MTISVQFKITDRKTGKVKATTEIQHGSSRPWKWALEAAANWARKSGFKIENDRLSRGHIFFDNGEM
jgi:hypothetical protein